MRSALALDIGASGPAALANFDGNWAHWFTASGGTILQSVQTDIGLTYGTILSAGTTPPAITMSGTPSSGLFLPILIKDALPGALGTWTGNVYIDGGTTPIQTFTSAASVPLTGALAGVTLSIAAGAALGDNTWTATASALVDQITSGGHNYTQATAAAQPTIGPWIVGGLSELRFDGVAQFMTSTLALAAPGTTPVYVFAILRQLVSASNVDIIASSNFGGGAALRTLAGGSVRAYAGVAGTATALAVNTMGAVEMYFDGTAASFIRAGSGADVASSAGNTFGGQQWLCKDGSNAFANAGFLAVTYVSCPTPPSQAFRTATRAAAKQWAGASLAA